MTTSRLAWRKSSRSDEEVNWVEVAVISAEALAVRDSKLPGSAVFTLDQQEWRALHAALSKYTP
ncbi:DUF397 domain-containing protein [Actinomadura oligospora]|uniref:DUF397 domain-containing protein n=1 Tax=Actinomadura oligospora TaxID=111804 RepID=UPI00047E18CF|nr:DUF397 domain-containing protein [Actinomadura oligospora]